MTLALIYARSRNYCIGKDGKLPWRLPDESRFFEQTTRGHPVIMGRKTYEDHHCVLPGRLNILVSRQPQPDVVAGIHVRSSFTAALELAAGHSDNAFVIGGAGLLAQAFPQSGRVFETIVDVNIEGDVYVPAFDFDGWRSTCLCRHDRDGRHLHGFAIFIRERCA